MRLENENGSVKTAFGPQTVVEIRYRPELDPSDGAGAGSRTRINGFGGRYTIHCATPAK